MTQFIERYERFRERLLVTLQSEKGQTLVEYGLLVVLIAIVVLIMLKGTGQNVNQTWSRINSGMNQ